MSESISSKYFTPSEFLGSNLRPNNFSIVHFNIASLRHLLHTLEHPFDIIGITETRLHDSDPLVNIEIDGYEFIHTPTGTQCGGAGIYVKSCYEFETIKNLSKSLPDISVSLFIELKREGHKNLIIGCIYRHHTPIPTFINNFFRNVFNVISKKSNKMCTLMGDFNIDLVKYAGDTHTGDFYDLLFSHSFRPLILQPTRVTTKTATLIDNIFVNDMTCHSTGGNLTSISDNFLQFYVTDLFQAPKAKNRSKFARDFRNLNKREFGEELANINWSDIIEEIPDVDLCYSNFYKKIENIFDFIAPYRKMTKKEVTLEQMPWITRGILVSMRVRDTLYKSWSSEKDYHYKSQIFTLYKPYRNIIVNLLRKSKGNYYSYFFLQNQSYVRKTWLDGVRNLINVSKKKNISPTKLIYKNEGRFTNIDMAESLNDFFVNIGSSVEAKIPKSQKHFSSFLCSANNKSIFLTPCTSTEILTIINNMKSSKSCGPNSPLIYL